MKRRTKLRDRVLPNYSRGEEWFHMASHSAGAVLGVAALAVCVVLAARRHNPWGVAGGAVYGVTMLLLYTASSVYHGLYPGLPKKVFQVIDHCSIFLLIAGTYTPIALVRLRPVYPRVAWGLFAFIWGMCALGIALNAVDLRKFMVFSMICYVGLGWSVVFFVKQLLACVPLSAFVWLIAGGVSYTAGSVLYGVGKKKKNMHAVMHVCMLLGSVMHFVCILICLG